MLGVVCWTAGVVEVFASRWACWQSPRGGEAEWTNNSKIGLMASDSHSPAYFYTESILSKYVIAAVSQKIFHLRPDALRHDEFIHIEQLTKKCCNLYRTYQKLRSHGWFSSPWEAFQSWEMANFEFQYRWKRKKRIWEACSDFWHQKIAYSETFNAVLKKGAGVYYYGIHK